MKHVDAGCVREAAVAAALLWLTLAVSPKICGAADVTGTGKQIFEKRCTGCHALDRNKEGPQLNGIFGRQAGSAPDFNYSSALKSSHFVWDEKHLDQWLTDTQSLVEDNNMDFHVSNPNERAQIIQYLKAISSR